MDKVIEKTKALDTIIVTDDKETSLLPEQDGSTITVKSLNLVSRSLVFSIVELDSPYGSIEYYAAGIPDKYSIEDTDGFQEFAEELDDETEIIVSVRSYVIGQKESEYPDEDELEFIKVNENKLERLYGIECIQSDRFIYLYELEEEY